MYTGGAVLDGTVDYRQLLDRDGILVCPAGSALEEIYRTSYQIGDIITVSCCNGQSKTYTVMGIVQDIQIGNSSRFFILPKEERSTLYPEISDFTGYVNLHTEQRSAAAGGVLGLRGPLYQTAVSGGADQGGGVTQNIS